jgi:hypothetical protein
MWLVHRCIGASYGLALLYGGSYVAAKGFCRGGIASYWLHMPLVCYDCRYVGMCMRHEQVSVMS